MGERSRKRFWIGVGGAAVFAVGLNWFVSEQLSPETYEAQALTADLSDQMDLAQATPAVFADPVPPSAAAATPIEAVEQFIAAELAEDYAASYGLLSEADRTVYLTPDAWDLSHNDLPTMVSTSNLFDVDREIRSTVEFQPQLNRRVGAVPASADVIWATSAEDGGFRVDFGARTIKPNWPQRDAAGAAALSWAEATQRCDDTSSLEIEGGLLGVVGFVPELCESTGAISAGEISSLSSLENPGPILNGLGPAADGYALVVPISGPVDMSVVVAPLADRWLVIGLDQP